MAAMPSEEELANLQRLSNDYVPDVQGDLVGRLQSTAAITLEYAQADPIFVNKTAALPRRYSHYRTVRGDGNCGWRALAFGYFEALIRTGDNLRIQSEIVRLKSLNNLLNAVGHDKDVYEDFVEETLGLLERSRVDLDVHEENERNLLASFNDAGIVGAVITHFRLIAGAWMRTNSDEYQPYIVDCTVDQYCTSKIDPFAVEIENMGIQAVVDAVIKPAGIKVDVLYLDRSQVEEMNTLSFPDPSAPSSTHYIDIPTITLLYRPGHYDILYKIGDLPQPSVQINQVSYAPPFASSNPFYSQQHMDLAQLLPGISTSGIPTSGIAPVDAQSSAFSYSIYPNSSFSSHGLPMTPEPYPLPSYSSIQSPSIHIPSSNLVDASGQDNFRTSRYMVEREYQMPSTSYVMEDCKTDAMKSAGESRAHFLNARFQPELWEPGSEYRSGRDSETPSRRGS